MFIPSDQNISSIQPNVLNIKRTLPSINLHQYPLDTWCEFANERILLLLLLIIIILLFKRWGPRLLTFLYLNLCGSSNIRMFICSLVLFPSLSVLFPSYNPSENTCSRGLTTRKRPAWGRFIPFSQEHSGNLDLSSRNRNVYFVTVFQVVYH